MDIIFVLDESSSMNRFSRSYIDIINKFIDSQKNFNPYADFTMVKFNTTITTLCINTKINTLPVFTKQYYNPSGTTSMYDAIGHAIKIKYNETSSNVIMFILTDGYDNNSHYFTRETIANQIEFLKSRGWFFVYIATDKNAKIEGEKLKIDTCLTYSESENSISKVAEACNVAVGHAIANSTGYQNEYSEQRMPTDISDLMDSLTL